MATKIANAYADSYIEQNYERKLSSMRNAMGWLSDQFKDLKDKLETSERALYEFRKENDILSTDMEGKVNITGSRLADFVQRSRQGRNHAPAKESPLRQRFQGAAQIGSGA